MRPTQALFKRAKWRKLPLTTKMVNKGYYKGTGSGSMGHHTKHGGYVIEWHKVRTYECPPDLDTFKLTPFVTMKMKPMEGRFPESQGGSPLSGLHYIRQWEEHGIGQ